MTGQEIPFGSGKHGWPQSKKVVFRPRSASATAGRFPAPWSKTISLIVSLTLAIYFLGGFAAGLALVPLCVAYLAMVICFVLDCFRLSWIVSEPHRRRYIFKMVLGLVLGGFWTDFLLSQIILSLFQGMYRHEH